MNTTTPFDIPSRVTSYDVAKLAGVSQSAVSRCFTPGAKASPVMRAKVMAAAEQLGYRPNAAARSLAAGRSRLVAMIVTEQSSSAYPELLFEFTHSFSERGVRLVPLALQSGEVLPHMLDPLWSHQVEGVVVATPLPDDMLNMMLRRGVQVVLYNRASLGAPVSAVMCDHRESGARLAQLLLQDGHRRFGFISGPPNGAVGVERLAGAREQIVRQAETTIVEVAGDYSYESGAAAVASLWGGKGEKPTAIVAANDLEALGAMDHLRMKLNLKIPTDVAVVGFDGIAAGRWPPYDLTTIRQPLRQMAEVTADLMLARIDNPNAPAEKRLFSGEVVIGTSARA